MTPDPKGASGARAESSLTEDAVTYSSAVAWSAEGARVGIVTCLSCGAAVFLSMDADSLGLHAEWHRVNGAAT